MNSGTLLDELMMRKREGRSAFAVLVDPDKTPADHGSRLAERCEGAGVDYLLVGGSLVLTDHLESFILNFKKETSIPVLIFPGSPSQVTPAADALLYLSLISGRNPELLIGQHVISAPVVRASGLEVLSTGYMVIDGGVPTTVSYMSGSAPIPATKPDIALCTAWASELLGQHVLYMDAGSGAKHPIPAEMIRTVAENTTRPLFVGGGMRTAEGVAAAATAGATVVVVGNALEANPEAMGELAKSVHRSARVSVSQ
jgi:putative glycerol-1-phosphate prenyltransferase